MARLFIALGLLLALFGSMLGGALVGLGLLCVLGWLLFGPGGHWL